MDVKQFHRRVLCIALLLSLCLTAMGATLYDLQINQGEALYERSQNKIAETQKSKQTGETFWTEMAVCWCLIGWSTR